MFRLLVGLVPISCERPLEAHQPVFGFRAAACCTLKREPALANAASRRTKVLHEAMLDGAIVCLDRQGCPQFDRLFYRRDEPFFYAFDLPYLDGKDLRDVPLIKRKHILRGIVPLSDSRLLYLDHVEAEGVD